MKRILLVGIALLSMSLVMAQDDIVRDGSTCENAILFDWENGHIQNANQTLWYAVTLDDSFLNKELVLYLNNLTPDSITVVASTYLACGSDARPARTDSTAMSANQFKTTSMQAILVNHIIINLGGTVYFKLTTEEGSIQFSSFARIPEPTALQENRENGFKVYPNKAAAGTALTVELPEDAAQGTVRLFDLSGRMLQQWTAIAATMQIQVNQAGTYLLQYVSAENTCQTLLICE